MKYYYSPSLEDGSRAGDIYICDHPLFNRCTLFRNGENGLIVVQEHYNNKTKARVWGPVTNRLAYDIYASPNFNDYFIKHAGPKDKNGLYPVITVRKIMWALRMKPLKKEIWETDI